MPELPEVETIRRQLGPRITGRRIVEAWGFDSPKFVQAPASAGSVIGALERRGKYLLADLAPPAARVPDRQLVVHLGMTGHLSVEEGFAPVHPHLRAWWGLDDATTLVFTDTRRFGRVAVVDHGAHDSLPTLAALGPEPWDPSLTPQRFWRSLQRSRRRVKTQLLSQTPIAGVGNIYADEALWRSGVHPGSRRVTRAQAAALLDALRAVLAEGVEHGGTTLRDYRGVDGETGDHQHHLDCYGRSGAPCPRCGSLLRSTTYDARTTTWCPSCQRR